MPPGMIPTLVGTGTANTRCNFQTIIIYSVCAFVCVDVICGGGAQAHRVLNVGSPPTDADGEAQDNFHGSRPSQPLAQMNITLPVGDGAELVVDTLTGNYQLILDGVVSSMREGALAHICSPAHLAV